MPSSLVVALRNPFVPVLRTVTIAPVTAAPLESTALDGLDLAFEA